MHYLTEAPKGLNQKAKRKKYKAMQLKLYNRKAS